jgi:hypothetical protein
VPATPDLTGLPILDVAIGLALLYFLLSIVASAVTELIATVFAWRARNLERAIRNMLADPPGEAGTGWTRKLYGNWRLQSLFEKPYAEDPEEAAPPPRRKPSYIPSRAFALALFDTLAPVAAGTRGAQSKDVIAEARRTVDSVPSERVRRALTDILDSAREDIDAARKLAEGWFDETMDRAKGWYKRYTQYWVWGLAVVVAFGLNVNSFHVGSRLWKDDALRTAVVAQAQEEVQRSPGAETPDADALERVAESVDEVQRLELPIGWADDNVPSGAFDWLGWIVGCFISAAAVSLGAPFWFDLLNRVVNLRGAGNPPAAPKEGAEAPKEG